MIKYNFKVEETFLDKTNNFKKVEKGTIIEVSEERLKQLNEAEVGRVVSAFYIEEGVPDKKTTSTRKSKETKTPELEIPETETSEAETPELETPELETPEVETPKTETPEENK